MSRRIATSTPPALHLRLSVATPPSHREPGFQQPGPTTRTIAQIDTKGDWADFVYRYQEVHLATVIEILQSIRQADMSPILSQIYSAPGGTEALDVLMKYMYVPFRSLSVTSLTPGPWSDLADRIHQIQGNGTDKRSCHIAQHHTSSNRFLPDPRSRRRRGRRPSHERAFELARKGTARPSAG